MNDKKHNFTSYIDGISVKNNGDSNGAVQEAKPKLLNGELVVGEVQRVAMLSPLSDRDSDRYGNLFVTNYRLSFVPLELTQNDESNQRNFLLGAYDVPLTAVGAVWLTDGGPARRRRLQPSGDMPAKVKGIQVICKNMKVLTFRFTSAAVEKARTVVMALVHYAFPKRHDLLFAFEYRETYYPTLPPDLNMFLRPGDWKRELERCACPHWRITCINGTSDAFMLAAGETLVVPSSVLDCKLMETARHFRSGRVPVWVWGRAAGAALLRSGELLPTDSSATAESVLLEQVRRSHPKLTPPHVIYLCGNSFTNSGNSTQLENSFSDAKFKVLNSRKPFVCELPPLPALQTSYKRLVDLCTPTNLSGFWTQESQYYSYLDSSRWLRHVASCLSFADEAAERLVNNVTVVLQEGDGVDYSALVSCLTQLLLDPHSRTISGFQSLIQKEWLALGHPFCDRLGLPRPGSPKDSKEPVVPPSQMAPVFLLFLDAVWQLQQQFPSHFQFTETYLTTLWDCTNNHIFDTFLFNCPRDRQLAVAKNFVQRPLWDWGEQFSEQDIALFYNPLYDINKPETPKQRISAHSTLSPKSADRSSSTLERLTPCTTVAAMEVWSQCYERWLPPLDAPHAGSVQYLVHNYATAKEIRRLKEKMLSLSIMSNRHSNGDMELRESPGKPAVVSRFYPFSQSRGVTSNLDSMQVSLIDASQLLDSQSLLNAPD